MLFKLYTKKFVVFFVLSLVNPKNLFYIKTIYFDIFKHILFSQSNYYSFLN